MITPGEESQATRPAAEMEGSRVFEIPVNFYSYFKELTGCAQTVEQVLPGSTLQELHRSLMARFPKLAAMQNSTLIAVGVEYQSRDYLLQKGDEVSLFPPVQGG
jgi:molybdopterin converting factor small subunit